MASAESILTLRRLTNEPDNVEPYSDLSLGLRLDAAAGELRPVAAEVWIEKASRYAELVDVQEGSSRRNLGDLYEQALAMAKQFGAIDDPAANTGQRSSRTRQIIRP